MYVNISQIVYSMHYIQAHIYIQGLYRAYAFSVQAKGARHTVCVLLSTGYVITLVRTAQTMHSILRLLGAPDSPHSNGTIKFILVLWG